MPTPTLEQLRRAIEISEQISKLEAELASVLGQAGVQGAKRAYTRRKTSAVGAPRRKRKKVKISPEGLANIIAAQKRRWAKVKREQKAAAK